jgi:membrane-bound lytic murein transglycosylase F
MQPRTKTSSLMIGLSLSVCLLIAWLSNISISTTSLARPAPTLLEQVKAAGELRVVSSNGPTTVYEGPDGLTGFEYSLVKDFADSLGVELIIETQYNPDEMLKGVASGAYHMAAAGLTPSETSRNDVHFSSDFLTVTQQLVYAKGKGAPTSLKELAGKEVLITLPESHKVRFTQLQANFPSIKWKVVDSEMIDLLEMINAGKASYAVVDSSIYSLHRYSYPKTKVAFDVSDPQGQAWALRHGQDNSLFNAAQSFLDTIRVNGSLATLTEDFFDRHIEEVTTGDAMAFTSRLHQRLPQWSDFMKEAAQEFELDWLLLAALSYQESHWKADAVSFTGVKGLMMLTKNTAKEVGVTNREDPKQSIYGGAKYLSNLFKRLPSDIKGEDRFAMALAAYNQGLGHLSDARILTKRMGGDPTKWNDVRKYMPLLAKKQYYTKAKHGYMRGWEPVKFVDNVRNYYKIISWHQDQQEFRLATAKQDKDRLSASNDNKKSDNSLAYSLL